MLAVFLCTLSVPAISIHCFLACPSASLFIPSRNNMRTIVDFSVPFYPRDDSISAFLRPSLVSYLLCRFHFAFSTRPSFIAVWARFYQRLYDLRSQLPSSVAFRATEFPCYIGVIHRACHRKLPPIIDCHR